MLTKNVKSTSFSGIIDIGTTSTMNGAYFRACTEFLFFTFYHKISGNLCSRKLIPLRYSLKCFTILLCMTEPHLKKKIYCA